MSDDGGQSIRRGVDEVEPSVAAYGNDLMVERKAKNPFKAALFVFGSFVFGYNAHHIIHECGHLIAGLLCGAKTFAIRSHPFSWSYTMIGGPHPGLVAWGGILFSSVLAFVVFAACYRYRSLPLFPVLLWCSLSFLINGVYFVVGALLDVGDPSSLMLLGGVNKYLLLSIGLSCLLIGGTFAIVAGGSLGLNAYGPRRAAVSVLAFPILAYLAMILIYTIVWNPDELRLWATFVGTGGGASLLLGWLVHTTGNRFAPKRTVDITWGMVIVMNILGASIVTIQFLLLAG